MRSAREYPISFRWDSEVEIGASKRMNTDLNGLRMLPVPFDVYLFCPDQERVREAVQYERTQGRQRPVSIQSVLARALVLLQRRQRPEAGLRAPVCPDRRAEKSATVETQRVSLDL